MYVYDWDNKVYRNNNGDEVSWNEVKDNNFQESEPEKKESKQNLIESSIKAWRDNFKLSGSLVNNLFGNEDASESENIELGFNLWTFKFMLFAAMLEPGASNSNSTNKIDEVATENNATKLNPKQVHFMQSSIRNSTGEYTVLGNAKALRAGKLDPDILRINVWKDATGKIWTLDHRRLAAFRLSNLQEVTVNWVTPDQVKSQMWKMTTTNGGSSIKLKLGNGKNLIVN
jgi:hypothetical protein